MSFHHDRNFQVIKGGLKFPPGITDMKYVSGYVTDTRYMGVVGLFMRFKVWYSSNPEEPEDLSQFFYFETEEFGFDEYASVKGNDPETFDNIKRQLFGGLGGKEVAVTEKEAFYLLQTFVDFNKKNEIPLPEHREEYMYYLGEPITMNGKERSVLQSKMCTPIVNNYQAIHYFLMRIFGKDFAAAANLVKGNVLMNQFETLPVCTMCMNTLDIHEAGQDTVYMAESVVEYDGEYTIIVSEVTVNSDHQIVDFSSRSSLRITQREAAMKLRKSEYVTVYKFSGGVESFENRCPEILGNTVSTETDIGNMYMRFRKNNDHVKKRVFRLSDDMEGLYFVSFNQGQILATAYSLSAILQLESELRESKLGSAITTTAKYEFKEPVMLEFIGSGIEDFNEYLEMVRSDGGDDE